MKHLADWLRKRTVLIIIVMAALLLQVISAVQYRYTRGLLERELEKSALVDLIASALRIQEILSKAEVATSSQLWHVESHLQDPDYMVRLAANMVKNEHDNIIGAGVGFKPNYFPSKDRLYEPYAHQKGDTIIVEQIGSDKHDYTQNIVFQRAMNGDTTKWTSPYLDAEGAHDVITTYALPVKDENGTPVGALAVDLDTDWISEVVNRSHPYPSSFTLVMSGAGELIAGPVDSVASSSLVQKIVNMVNDSTVEREKRANGRVTGFAFFDEERGESGHVYYAPKKYEPRWQMVLVCYDHEVFGKLDEMRNYIMWMALVGLAVLGVIIQLFVRSHRRLQETQMSQERIRSELRIAKEIQKQMLPQENSVKRSDVAVMGSLVPAREVGGDLFDFFLRDEKLFFCIGDVSGKGVPSAMLMSVTHSLFRSASAHENNPAHMMQVINETSCHGNEANMFVTLFIGVLDLPTGRLRYCNAGHDKPLLIEGLFEGQGARSKERGLVNSLDAHPNLPIGLFADAKYEVHEQMLTPNSLLFLYTDGLTEAKNAQRKQFKLNSVKDVLQGVHPSSEPQVLLQTMTEAVNRFMGDAAPSDDLTMLAIRYSPEKEQDELSETLILKNDLTQVKELSRFIKDITTRMQLESKLAGKIRLAVEEAVVNVMDYAYPPESEGKITIEAKSDGRRVKFIISDTGCPFDPTKALQVDTTLSAEERPVGGLGIHMVRQLMDSINYERVDGKNILTLRKAIGKGTSL